MPSVVAVPTPDPDPASPLAFVRAIPGPALLFAPDLSLTYASEGAALLSEALRRDGDAATAIKQTAAEAQAVDVAAQGRVELPHEDARRVYELTAVPCAGGQVVVLARDVSFETNMRAALIESRQRYKDLVDIASDFAWETGPDGRFAFVSGGGAMGYAAEALIGTQPADLLVDPEAAAGTLPFAATGVVTDSEIWLRDAAGAAVCLLATATPLTDGDGNWRGARGLCRDVTRERARDAAFAQAKMRDRVVTYVIDRIRNEAEPEAMLEAAVGVLARATNADAAAIYLAESEGPMSEAARYGEPPAESVLAPWLEDLAAHDPMLEERDRDALLLAHAAAYRGRVNGAIALWRRDAARDWRDDDRSLLSAVTGQLGVVLTQIIDQRGLERVSRTDGLTGLLNRAAFMGDLDQCLARAMVRETPGVLIYLDLDNFKPVNDVLGHDQGDAVLRRIADVLRGLSRRHDLVARLGGDEFAIWLDDAAGEAGCAKAQAICAALTRMRDYSASPEQPLGGSIGVAVYAPSSGEDVDALVKRADVAMYRAKRAGKNDWRLAPPILAETGPDVDRG